MTIRPKLFTVICFLFTLSCYAQNQHNIDSLLGLLHKKIHDSTRANVYCLLTRAYWDYLPEKAMEYANQAYVLSERIGYKPGLGEACHVLAVLYTDKGNNIEGIQWNNKALQYQYETKDSTKIYNSYYALGLTYYGIGDHEKALKYDFDCLSYFERTGNKADMAGIYHNISSIYADVGKKKEAMKFLLKAATINQVTGNKDWLGRNYFMLANYYMDEGNIDSSMICYNLSRELFLLLGQKDIYAMNLVGIGRCNNLRSNYKTSFDSIQKALSIFREIHDKNGIAWSYNNLGQSFTRQKKFKDAAICLDSCLRLCKELNKTEAMRNVYQRLYQLDSASGNFANAYIHYAQYIAARDSVNNIEKMQIVLNQQLRFEYSKKEEKTKAEQEKKDAVQTITRNALIAGLTLVMLLAIVLYNRFRLKKKAHDIITYEKERSDNLLLNILPAEVAEELKETGGAKAKHFDNVTVLFTDFVNFTKVAETLTPQELVNELHACFKAFDDIIGKHNIEKIKTIGDAYLAVCGLPLADELHPKKVVQAALEIVAFMQNRHQQMGNKTFEIRIGVNSGSVVAGIVGVKKFAYDIWGDTVNTAARMEQHSEAGKVNISGSTYELVKDQFHCEHRGKISAKGKGEIDMYFVV